MAANTQLDNLCALYAERSEPELLALYDQREDLTDIAQQALLQVMQQRGIAAPEDETVAAPAAPVKEENAAFLAADEVCVFTFSDAFQVAEALRVLEQHSILCRMVNWDEVTPRDDGGPMRLGLIVKRPDAAAAKKALQKAMNLFPAAEGHAPLEDLVDHAMVGIFHRPDALLVAHALGSAGVSYLWHDSRDDDTMGEEEVIIEVQPHLLDEAHNLAQQALANAADD